MSTGAMRHRLTVQVNQPVRDATGYEAPTWVDLKKIWGDIRPVTGKEYFADQQRQAEVTAKIYIRDFPELREDMRVLFQGRIFAINAILADERHKYTTLMVTEAKNGD